MEHNKMHYKANYFKGKVMLLSGGTSKMLLQIALDFMDLGGSVALLSRREGELDKHARKLMEKSKTKGKVKAKGYKGDVRKFEDLFKVVDNIIKDFGKIDYLINGASGNFLADAETLSSNGFKTILEIDTIGTFNLCKLVFNKCMKQKKSGVIINISSTVQLLGTYFQIHSGSAKAGVDNITKVLALEWGPHNVRVNGVSPGLIEDSEGFDRFMDLTFLDKKNKNTNEIKENFKEKIHEYIPAQRLGTKFDISNAVLFLLSDTASYITGQTIVIDGGYLGMLPNYMALSEKVKNFLKPKF